MIKEYLKLRGLEVEKTLRDYFEELNYPEVIKDGMKYSVLNGGKRLRPVLLLMTLELLGKDINLGFPTAAAIEMIHSYSLVHDDLPALDNDDYRRGKSTTHKKFGEAEAILIGDSLLTYAFYILANKNEKLSSEKTIKIIEKISYAAGTQGMIGGQMIDIESEGKNIDLPTLQYIHTHKTGMMIRVPIQVGAIIGEATEKEIEYLTEYADLIGLAFQIKDDILDIEGDFETIGKPIGSDQGLNKATYPSIFGLERTKEMLKEKVEKAKEIIEKEFGEKGKYFVALAEYIEAREK
ncbi:polyprenyl synthetase family protein [Haliovirga abyssi]|uniref:Farnesyl-diphosphate synthase n=1 Tax=Haliovirga abyssi TaxID=2996794 RepID=A0AAU9D6S7_9FUSO|nr:farnesyl diphosphate synthase [Haliovirga abyssi]BDU50253.1 farnesyl-diphosphate synthase [Haliovirga abyssi]